MPVSFYQESIVSPYPLTSTNFSWVEKVSVIPTFLLIFINLIFIIFSYGKMLIYVCVYPYLVMSCNHIHPDEIQSSEI